MTIYTWLLVLIWAVFIIYWAVSAFSTKRNIGNAWLRGLWLRVVMLVVVIVLLRAIYPMSTFTYHLDLVVHPLMNSIGVVLAALGIAFAVWARYCLGRNWGMPMSVKESPELVTTGPYAYVRHSIYTGVILAMIGTALVVGTVWAIVLVFGCVYFAYSAFKEEAMLLKEFPEQYPAYMKRTKMLIPFVF